MQPLSAIYVRFPNWIGDLCMSLPSLHTLLDTGVPLVACARPWARDLLAAYALDGHIDMKGRWREDRAAVNAWRKKAQHAHPHGLLLPDSLSSAMVFKFGGVPSAGYRDDGRSLILRWPVKKPGGGLHAVQSWHYVTTQALHRWGLPASPLPAQRRLGLRLAPRHHQEAQAAMAQAGLRGERFILIAPTATGLHHGKVKVWPYFDALTRVLQDQGHVVAMCPPASEQAAAREAAPTAQCLPSLNLGAFATLTRHASLVICNDSGVSHLAAAAGARQLTLFGVTQPERTGPWSDTAQCLGSAHAWPNLDQVLTQLQSILPPAAQSTAL
ncbi:heptosyltransferase [Allopusillimonas soli]|uniref:Heptosyltransferase n=1 Tax=Allopusillimonas soli TaxID=659016 RepID=A0A853FEI1_9BURK|nr:glycosyltransferase family 9 protein [Allopusillimonas soli]NYT38473.1 heptosyltransferase [Allopusillimonas soli]TEA72227.1 heptosyltransferase [Allopusillimonas soli]